MTTKLDRAAHKLAEAALAWWLDKRPLLWSEDVHRRYPMVNAATARERQLATAACHYREAKAAKKGATKR